MSDQRPEHPETERTYQIRRAVVLGAAVLALILIVWMISSLFGSSGKKVTAEASANSTALAGTPTPTPTPSASGSPSASSSGTPSGSASATPSASGSATPSASASATPSASASATPTGPVKCGPSVAKLTVQGSPSVKSGAGAAFNISIHNTSSTPCLLDFVAAPLAMTVTSGSDRIWSSAGCPQWTARGRATIKAGATWSYTATWPTLRSTSGCKLVNTKLGAGTYVFAASTDNAGRAVKVFVLT